MRKSLFFLLLAALILLASTAFAEDDAPITLYVLSKDALPSPFLRQSGDPTIAYPDGTIALTNRVNNYDAIDITKDALKNGGTFLPGLYTFTVTGQTDPSARLLMGMTESPWAELTSRTSPDESGHFVLSYSVRFRAREELANLPYSFRIQTPPDDLHDFTIEEIVVQVVPSAPAATPIIDGEPVALYTLDGYPSASLKRSGEPTISTEGVAISLTNRINNYDAIDLVKNALKIDGSFLPGLYTFTVTGQADPSIRLVVGMTESPWTELTPRTSPDASGHFVLSYSVRFESAEELEALTYNFRIQTQPGDLQDFTIETLDVTVVPSLTSVTAYVPPTWDLSIPSLSETYADFFPIGNIVEPSQLDDAEMTAMFVHQYRIVTPENAMKPAGLSKQPGQYDFTEADKILHWAAQNGLDIHGHTLVWHSQSAPWLTQSEDGAPLTRAEASANLHTYIESVAGHYKGQLSSWDVVNEAFRTGVSQVQPTWQDALRKDEPGGEGSPWYQAYANGADPEKGESGADYIYDAFATARLVDPHAVLYYNDFNETEPGKREAIAQMTEQLNEKWREDPRNDQPDRLLVEGIGMQSHYWTGDFDADLVRQCLERFAATGAAISISELDLPHGTYQSFQARMDAPTEPELALQAQQYRALFDLYKAHADTIRRVTFWGKANPQSWRAKGDPLLFDKSFAPTPAFYAITETP